LLIKDDKNSSRGADALEDIVMTKKKANLANEIEVLKTATLMERVVWALNANLQFYSEGKVKKSELYKNNLFDFDIVSQTDSTLPFSLTLKFNKNRHFQVAEISNRWYKSGELIKGKQGEFIINITNAPGIDPAYKYYINWQPTFNTAKALTTALKITQLNREASILKISIDTEVPQKGTDILNQLVDTYNKSTIEDKNKVTESTIKFIDSRLLLLTSELGKVEGSLQSFRQRNEVIDMEAQGTQQFASLKETEQKLTEQEVRLQVIDMIRGYVGNPTRRFTMAPSTLGIEDPTLLALVADYNKLQLTREEQLRTIPEANPAIQGLEGQIEKVRVSILENLNNIRRSGQSLRDRLLSDYNSTRGQIRTIPTKERELLEIARQQGIKEKLYLFLLQKREESAITMASNISNSYSLDPASTSWAPVSPNTSSIYKIAFVLGILIPILFIYLRDLLNDKVTTRTDITKTTEMPIIGEIAHNQGQDRKLVISAKDRSIISEQFRVIRTNLQFMTHSNEHPVILVTSSMGGEGKTFTSMNVGAVWAVANKKTVILEFDLRKPKISISLNFKNVKGITNFIVGNATAAELPRLVEGTDNLYVVPAGPIPPNPSEIIMDPKMEELFSYLRANFDLIVIDSAPVGLVSDAKVLSRFANSTLYVVRQRYTLKKQLEFVNDLYEKKTLPNMSLIVNDVKTGGANSYYGYGYGYGYGYSSNYNYGSEEEEKNWWQRLTGFYK
jgi:capsular exopolysaccharide synthesis family protein